jgi:hypothetical protein
VVGSYLDSLPKSKKKKDSSFLPFKKAPDCSSLNGQRNKKTSRGGTEKSGVYSISPFETLTQAIGNHPGSKLDEVMKYPRSYQQLHEKEVFSRVARGGRVTINFKGFARGMSPGILILLVLFINLFGSVQAQTEHSTITEYPEQTTSFAQTTTGGQTTTEAETTTIWTEATIDCEVLNAWKPDHANSTGCCNEEGITCNEDRITQMYVYPFNNISDFSGRSLSGSIPDSIVLLDALVSLVLNNNQFTGQIPARISYLVNLQNLDLYNNLLSGIIPDDFGSMVNLQSLYLNDNMLSGSIPESIGTLNLKIIYLDSNQLSGEIPSSLSDLSLNVTCIVLPNSGLCREESFTKCGVDILGIHSKLTHTVCPDDGESYNTTLTLTMPTKTAETAATTTVVDDVCQVALPTTTAESATDCEILNSWVPLHSSSSGCCEGGLNNPNPRIYCINGRVVELYFTL